MQQHILDLDRINSISNLGVLIDTKYSQDAIIKIISLIKSYGRYNGIVYRDYIETAQYYLPIKYLGHTLPISFEFDRLSQFINIFYYKNDSDKYYLKIFLSISEEPNIKYLENDKSGYLPSYTNAKINIKPGAYLMHFSHCLLNFIGYSRVRLDDDSYLVISNSNGMELKAKLWLYLLLTKNKSWYAKFGYEPIDGNSNEYHMKIKDVATLKLDEIANQLNILTNCCNKSSLNTTLIEFSNIILGIIGNSTETLGSYANNHSIKDFIKLTYYLFQSIYSNMILAKIYQEGMNKENDVIIEKEEWTILTFSWYKKCHQLFIANVCQVNNNIKNYYYKKN